MIENLVHSQEELWEEYIRAHPNSTAYHGLLWRDLFQAFFHYKPFYLIARNGGRIEGVMPLFKIPSLHGSSLVSIPFRDRADPLCSSPAVLIDLVQHARDLVHKLKCRSLIVKSITELPEEVTKAASLENSQHWIRSFVSLPESPQSLWEGIGDKTRNMIRQAERSQLQFSHCLNNARDVDASIALFRLTQHRLGIPPFPAPFYRRLCDSFTQGGGGFICSVKHGSDILASAILLRHRDGLIYAYAGSLPKGWPLRVNDYLVWRSLLLAMEIRAKTFDFGSDSIHQDSLLFFKKKWGVEQRPINYYHYVPGKVGKDPIERRDSSQGPYPFLRQIVRRLPTPLYNLTEYLTPYFG